jgi:hypothetical protein
VTDHRLVVATPVRGAEFGSSLVTVGYSENLRALARELPVETIEAAVTFGADVVRARNRLVGIVLRDFPSATHVLWWDDDVWPEERRIVREMLDTGEDVIAAPYPRKRIPSGWVHQLLSPCPVADEHGVQPVRAVGFGFTITSVACLRKMTEVARVYTDHPRPERIGNLFGQLYDSVSDQPVDDCLLSEDYSFCKRWRELGRRIGLYVRAGLVHHAGSHAFSAHDVPGGVVEQ